tara:strand:+ start:2196 stop:2750 length:555 start_codon:yes stop_codon:yes gene_type:complete
VYKSKFSEKDWSFLVQYPCRVGLWMSDLEMGGGDGAEIAERRALENIIIRAQEKYENRAFIKELIKETEETSCDIQAANDQNVLQDAPKVLNMLQANVEKIDVNCFKLICLDVAEAVAKAAPDREFGAHNLHGGPESGWFGLYPLLSSLLRLGRGPKVSPTEKNGINALIDALKANNIAMKWRV